MGCFRNFVVSAGKVFLLTTELWKGGGGGGGGSGGELSHDGAPRRQKGARPAYPSPFYAGYPCLSRLPQKLPPRQIRPRNTPSPKAISQALHPFQTKRF